MQFSVGIYIRSRVHELRERSKHVVSLAVAEPTKWRGPCGSDAHIGSKRVCTLQTQSILYMTARELHSAKIVTGKQAKRSSFRRPGLFTRVGGHRQGRKNKLRAQRGKANTNCRASQSTQVARHQQAGTGSFFPRYRYAGRRYDGRQRGKQSCVRQKSLTSNCRRCQRVVVTPVR